MLLEGTFAYGSICFLSVYGSVFLRVHKDSCSHKLGTHSHVVRKCKLLFIDFFLFPGTGILPSSTMVNVGQVLTKKSTILEMAELTTALTK